MIGQGGVILTCAVINNTAFDAQWRQPNDVIKHQNGSEWGIFLISFAWNIRSVKIFVVAWWMVEELDTQHRDMSKDNNLSY